jgi:hypothetical protein
MLVPAKTMYDGFGGMALAAIFLKASREDKVVWTSDEVICLAATTSL